MAPGQTLLHQFLSAYSGDSFWSQSLQTTQAAGGVVTVSDTAPTNDQWNMAAIEIPTPTPTPSPTHGPAGLPGEQLWGPGQVSSYLFGTTDSRNYAAPNVETAPSVQNYIKQAHLSLLREEFNAGMTDADIQTRLNTVAATGMHCLGLLDAIDNLDFMKHVVSLTASTCPMYEFGNEPDGGGVSTSTYLSEWTTDIPQLRALAPGALFGGPATAYVNSFTQQFIQAIPASGPTAADFITFHHYPCYGVATKADCIAGTPAWFEGDYSQVVGWETQSWGHKVPTGISEYNFDPGSGNLYTWASDGAFMYQWEKAAVSGFITAKYDFAIEYTTLNWAGYGNLDMFDDHTLEPKGQFWGLVDMGQQNGSGSTLAIPNPCC